MPPDASPAAAPASPAAPVAPAAPTTGKVGLAAVRERIAAVQDAEAQGVDVNRAGDMTAAPARVVPPEAPTENPAPDDAEPPQDGGESEEDMLHGLAVEAVLQALRDGTIPDELLDKLRIKAKYGDTEELVSLADMRGGALRLKDYSRKTAELKTQREEFDRTQSQFLAMTEAWSKHDDERQVKQTRRDLERLIGPKAVRALAEDLAIEVAQEKALQEQIPEPLRPYIFERLERSRALEAKLEDLTMRASTDAQTVEQQRRQEWVRANKAVLDQHLAPAFKRENITDTRTARAVFGQHLGALWDRSRPLSQDVIDQAAIATREELVEMARVHAGAAAAPANGANGAGKPPATAPQPPHLPARRAASAGRAAAGGGGPIQTISAFRTRLNKLGTPGF